MTKKTPPMLDDHVDFKALFNDVKPVTHDKYVPSRKEKQGLKRNKQNIQQVAEKQANALFEFSDGYEVNLSASGPLKWVKEGERSDQVKQLRSGQVAPELILDLHGMLADSAKAEIAALLYEAHKRHYACVCIVHGIGSGVLKRKVPSWLVQHPYVLGFHQAPLEWGGKGALLVLVKQPDLFAI